MKKLVPDPPPILCVKPGLTHDQALRRAAEHLDSALNFALQIPDQPMPKHQTHLSDTQIHLRLSKAFLKAAMVGGTVQVEL